MKRITQLSVVLSLLLGLTSCNNFGKKVKIEGTRAEIFYTEGATESEAKKTGEFLKTNGFLTNDKAASIQVTKEKGEYTVRFVYNKEYYEKNKELESFFKTYGATLSKEVFNGEKVNIALADKYFKDFKTIPFEQTEEKPVETADTGLAPAAPPAGLAEKEKDEFDHDSQGGVNFYWKGISDQESKRIADYIAGNGAFAGGAAEIYMTKEGDRYILQFPVKKEYRNDAEIIAEVEKVSKQIRENVFANNPYSFQMTDEKLNAIKSFDY
jgi:hypothetical protein